MQISNKKTKKIKWGGTGFLQDIVKCDKVMTFAQEYCVDPSVGMIVIKHLKEKNCIRCLCSLKISCQTPKWDCDESPQGAKTSCCCSDINRKMQSLYWSGPILISLMQWRDCLWIKLACDKKYCFFKTWIERQRSPFVHMDFSWVYHVLNSMWKSSSELGHISITFIFHACAWVCTDPARPLGSLIIHTLRPECKNSFFWLKGCTERQYMGGNMDSFKVIFLQGGVDVAWFAY